MHISYRRLCVGDKGSLESGLLYNDNLVSVIIVVISNVNIP